MILPYGKPDDKQYVTCAKSGKKKTATSKKSGCPFSLIFKKLYIGYDPNCHPAYNPDHNELSDDNGKIGIYYLSKFRGLHNHQLDLSYIYSDNQNEIPVIQFGVPKKFNEDKEVQGRYETDALEDLLVYESKKFDKLGKYLLKMKNDPSHEFLIINPECGAPSFVWVLDDNIEDCSVKLTEAIDISLKMFDKIETTALDSFKRDFTRKAPVVGAVLNSSVSYQSTSPQQQ